MRPNRFQVLFVCVAAMSLPVAGCGGARDDRVEGSGRANQSNPVAAPANQAPPLPTKPPPKEEQPKGPSKDPDGVPTNIPKAVPNPEPPADPAKIAVKAVATSSTSNPLAAMVNYNQQLPPNYTRISVRIDLAWSAAKQAAQYQVAVNEDGSDKYVLKATLGPNTTKYRMGGGLLTNAVAVGRTYKFMVRALNSSGQLVAQGEGESTPEYPLPMPRLVSPKNGDTGATIQPEFIWTPIKGADGYYVEVFSGTYYLPMWRGYSKGGDLGKMRYGDGAELYPGTIPAIWTNILTPGQRYTWTVTAFKTDSGSMATAKAIAEANAPSQLFIP